MGFFQHSGNCTHATFTEVAAADATACGIRSDRTVVCWGDGFGDEPAWADDTFDSISVGAELACAIREVDRSAECWGRLAR